MRTIGFDYTYKGVTKKQTVVPVDIQFVPDGYPSINGAEALPGGWYLNAIDPKQGRRTFALSNIADPGPGIIRGYRLVIFPSEWQDGLRDSTNHE